MTPPILRHREPAVSGLFYPAESNVLERQVVRLLDGARARIEPPAPAALVVPHAGYVYSGSIAATGWASVAELEGIERVVIIGPAHRVHVAKLASPGVEIMRTPIGDLEVDVSAIRALPHVESFPAAHQHEHCIEVQLPFVKRLFPTARVVPLLVGGASAEEVEEVIECLWEDGTLIAISSDLSHHRPYEEAKHIDDKTVQRITSLSTQPLHGWQACGAQAINGLVRFARRHDLAARALDVRNSADTAGGRERVVGYAAIGFYHDEETA